VKSYKRKIKS